MNDTTCIKCEGELVGGACPSCADVVPTTDTDTVPTAEEEKTTDASAETPAV